MSAASDNLRELAFTTSSARLESLFKIFENFIFQYSAEVVATCDGGPSLTDGLKAERVKACLHLGAVGMALYSEMICHAGELLGDDKLLLAGDKLDLFEDALNELDNKLNALTAN